MQLYNQEGTLFIWDVYLYSYKFWLNSFRDYINILLLYLLIYFSYFIFCDRINKFYIFLVYFCYSSQYVMILRNFLHYFCYPWRSLLSWNMLDYGWTFYEKVCTLLVIVFHSHILKCIFLIFVTDLLFIYTWLNSIIRTDSYIWLCTY